VEDLEFALDLEENSQEQRKLLEAVREFGTYITANRTFIPNYGDRCRHGETISTGYVESAINQVVKRVDFSVHKRRTEGFSDIKPRLALSLLRPGLAS
jgi:hypothetical protein